MKQLLWHFVLSFVFLAFPGLVNAASSLKVLVVGNSYSNDAFGFLPFVLKSANPDMALTLGICMDGSQTIQGQLTHANNETKYYTRYEKWKSRSGWVVNYNKSLSDAVDDEVWDWIVLHQASASSCNINTITPYLGDLLDYFRNTKQFAGKIAWMITPAYAEGTTAAGVNKLARVSSALGLDYTITTDEMQQRIMEISQFLYRLYEDIDAIIPCGMGIAYARHTWLDMLGDWAPNDAPGGNLVYRDGHHLQYGVGNLIEAWIAALSLTDSLDLNVEVTGYRWMNGDIMAKRDSRNQPIATGMDAMTQQFARLTAFKAWHDFMPMTDGQWNRQVVISQSDTMLVQRNQLTLNADCISPDPDDGIEWSTTNPFVATVDNYGVVTAVQPGNCRIYASLASQPAFFAACNVRVLHRCGDVNKDGEVGIADVTLLINLLLSDEHNEMSDVNGDSETDIADVTALINILLNEL